MYRILSITVLLIAFTWLWHFLKKNNQGISTLPSLFSNSFNDSFRKYKSQNKGNLPVTIQSLKPILFMITFVLFLIMFLTSFIPVVISGNSLNGLVLLLHVAVAPVFSIFIAGTIITYARSSVFSKDDLTTKNKPLSLTTSGYKKLLFWLIAITSVFVMLPITLSMFPLFDTEGQIFLWNIHKYSVLIFTIFIILHISLVIISKKNK